MATRDLPWRLRWPVILLTAAALLGSSSIALGQTPLWLDLGLEPEPLHVEARDALRRHLSGRYRVWSVNVDTSDRAQRTVFRHLSLWGDFTSNVSVTPEAGKHGKQLALARAFLEQEAMVLFNLASMDIRFRSVFEGRPDAATPISISYDVYAGDLPLAGASVGISFDGNDRLVHVSANLLPIPSDLREAVKRPTLDQRAIEQVVRLDLEADAKQPKPPFHISQYIANPRLWYQEPKKVAVAVPPYVIWYVHGYTRYDINAFTGEILKKIPGLPCPSRGCRR